LEILLLIKNHVKRKKKKKKKKKKEEEEEKNPRQPQALGNDWGDPAASVKSTE
jgi:hypothetical protein